MKAWLKGGLIGIGVIVILMLVRIFTVLDFSPSLIARGSDSYQTIAVIQILLIEWFIYGAVVGLIIELIKNKAQK